MRKLKFSSLTLGVGVAMALASGCANAGVMVHLFQWKFNDIANECETVLGPKGFDAVQITPPNEHYNSYRRAWNSWSFGVQY